MLFTVQKTDNTGDVVFVTGETRCGVIKGIWKSETLRPVIGKSYNIELTLGLGTGAVDRRDVKTASGQAKTSISVSDGKVLFTGICEAVEDIYFIRFSDDGLEMLDIENDDHTIKAGDHITFYLPFEETVLNHSFQTGLLQEMF